MQKIKPLKPNMRIKKRYVAFELLSDNDVKLDETITSFKKSILKFIGEYGYSMSGFQIIKKESNNKNIIVKTNSNYIELIKTGASLIKDIKNEPVILRSTRTSGILKKII